MAITPRQPVKSDTRRPTDTNARGLVATKPKVIQDRSDITKVTAFASGHKGQQQKRRKSWLY